MSMKLNTSGLVKRWAGLVGKLNGTQLSTGAACEHDPLFAEVLRLEKLIAEQQAEFCRVNHAAAIPKISAEHQKAIDLAG